MLKTGSRGTQGHAKPDGRLYSCITKRNNNTVKSIEGEHQLRLARSEFFQPI